MKALWWVSLLVVLYTYAGYPLLIALLARLRPRPWQRAPQQKTVSIVMAVHNGAAMLPWKIQHLLSLDPDLISEIILVSDGSTDATNNILRNVDDPRIRSILLPEQAGKSSALNSGIAAATGEILLFTDIRPRIEPGAIAALISNFADPQVGCVAGELIVQPGGNSDVTAATIGGLYWRYEQAMRNCEAAFDSPVGVYGGFYAARRSLVRPVPAGLILDDMFQPLSIIRQGYRSVVDRTALVVDTWPGRSQDEFNRKVRTLAGNFQLIARAPWVLSPRNRVLFQLVSHKLLRLVVPWFFLVMLFSATVLASHSGLWVVIAVLEWLALMLAAAASRFKLPGPLRRLASPAGAVFLLNAAAVVALYRALFTRGPLWKIWLPTATPQFGSRNPDHAEALGRRAS